MNNDSVLLKRLSRLVALFRGREPRYAGVTLPFSSLEDFRRHVPVSGREELWAFGERAALHGAFLVTATTGSTRDRLLVAQSRSCARVHRQRLGDIYRAAGVRSGDLCLNLCSYSLNSGGRLMEAAFRDIGCGVIPAGPFGSPAERDAVCALVHRFRPAVVNSYTNQLYELFSVLGRNHRVRQCLVNGEPLLPAYKKNIERMSGAAVHDHYGCMELSGMAVALDAALPWMRVFDRGLLLEVEGKHGRAAATGTGALVVTDLENTCMPFIRYRVGDRVIVRRTRDGGREMRVLGRLPQSVLIDGEVQDISLLVRELGAAVGHPRFFCILTKNPLTCADRMVLYVADTGAAGLAALSDAVRRRGGFWEKVSVVPFAGDIPRSSTGKFRHVIDARSRR